MGRDLGEGWGGGKEGEAGRSAARSVDLLKKGVESRWLLTAREDGNYRMIPVANYASKFFTTTRTKLEVC